MAERRMFAKSVVESDAFVDMPATAQALYLHLGMNADDDGFVMSPKMIQRSVGAAADDMRILVAKGFLIPFDSGVVVITHWKVNNYIQSDRRKDTICLSERNMLQTGDDRIYRLLTCEDTTAIQDVYNVYTQNRLEETSVDKNREGYEMVEEHQRRKSGEDFSEWRDAYNELCPSLQSCRIMSDKRKSAVRSMVKQGIKLDEFKEACQMAECSDFLKGKNDRGWKANPDWMFNATNVLKVLEGNYGGSRKHYKLFEETDDGYDEIAKMWGMA